MVAGNIGDLGIATQAAKGTAAAAPLHRIMLTGGGMGPTREISDLEESTSQRMRLGSYVARARAGGTPAFYARPDAAGIFLYAAMGGKAVTGSADPYAWTFTLAAVQPYLTLWRNVGGLLAERFIDCKLSQLVIRSAEGAAMTMEATVVGLQTQYETAAQSSPAIDVGTPFVHYDGQSQLLLEGAAVSSIRSSVVTLATGAQAVPGDSLGGVAVTEGLISVTIETQQLIEDVALWNRLHYGTATPSNHAPATRNILELGGAPAGLDLKWTRRDDAGVALAPARELELLAPRLQVRSMSGFDVNSNGDPLVGTVTYMAYQPSGGVSGLTAKLKNATATITAS